MQKCSYESILGAVGRVLDEAEAQSFTIRDSVDGLLVETSIGAANQQIALNLRLNDLAELVARNSRVEAKPNYGRSYGHDESTLTHFLARHRQLVGAER
jgi:hypothetical protein